MSNIKVFLMFLILTMPLYALDDAEENEKLRQQFSKTLNQEIDLNNINKRHTSLSLTNLHAAVIANNQVAVVYLLKNDANVNFINKENKTPLAYAKQNGQKEIIQLLIENGAVVDENVKENFEILRKKYKEDYKESIQALKNSTAEANKAIKDRCKEKCQKLKENYKNNRFAEAAEKKYKLDKQLIKIDCANRLNKLKNKHLKKKQKLKYSMEKIKEIAARIQQ